MSAEEIHRLAQEIATDLGGEAHSTGELAKPPVRNTGPDEWRLPGSIDGHQFERFTQTGPRWVRDTPGSRKVLAEVGLSPPDVTVYGSLPSDPKHEPFVIVMAYRARYADPPRALVALRRIFSAPDTVWEDAKLGATKVIRGTSTEFGPMGTTYLWIDSDALYQIVCPDPEYAAHAAEAVTPFAGEGDQ